MRALSIGMIVVLAPLPARAERLHLEVALDGSIARVTERRLSVTGASEDGRVISGRADGGASVPVLTFGFDTAIVDRDTYVYPMLGARIGGAFGPTTTLRTTVDGSVVSLEPAHAVYGDVTIAGFGVRRNLRRWTIGATTTFGLAIVAMGGSAAYGAGSIDVTAIRVSPLLRSSFDVCRRVDPMSRACFTFALHVWDVSVLDGGSLGLRWEVSL